MPTGTAIVDFGTGASDAGVTITGQGTILAGSLVEAWMLPAATTDHTADEHLVEPIKVVANNIVAGTGFDIDAIYQGSGDVFPTGKWSVGWVWA